MLQPRDTRADDVGDIGTSQAVSKPDQDLFTISQASIEAVKTLCGCPWLTVRTSGTQPPRDPTWPVYLWLVFENGWTRLWTLRDRKSIQSNHFIIEMFSVIPASTPGGQSHLAQASLSSKIFAHQNTARKLGKTIMPQVLSMFDPDLRQPSNSLHLPATPAQDTHNSYVSISEPEVKSLTLGHNSTVDTSDGMPHRAGKSSMGRRSSNCSEVTSQVTFARTLYLIPYSRIRPSSLPMLQAHHRY